MAQGMYQIKYTNTPRAISEEYALISLYQGLLCGMDRYGIRFDGKYSVDEDSGTISFFVDAVVPQGVALITGKVGIKHFSFESSFPIQLSKETTGAPLSFDVLGDKIYATAHLLKEFNKRNY